MTSSVDEIIVIYNSDSGIWGDLIYVAKKLSKSDKCELCDITHTYKKKPKWKSLCDNFEVPIKALYRDQLDRELQKTADKEYPSVIFRYGKKYQKRINLSI